MPRDSSKIAESESPESIREDMFPCGTKSLIVHRKLSYTGKVLKRAKGKQSSSRSTSHTQISTRRQPPMTSLPVCVNPIVAHIKTFA